MSLAQVEELLRTRIGLDPASAGPGIVAHAARRRMRLLGLGDGETERYARRIETSDDEFQELVEEVVIPESWFFRDELPFQLLGERAAGLLSAGSGRPWVRVLSMPCASGEEPYSVAMTLLDAGLAPDQIQVDGVDLSRSALERARRAVYSANAFRTGDLGFRDRYFERRPAGYELVPAVSRLVRFHHLNLLADDLLADAPPYDVIFCRNLLIYLDAPARGRVLGRVDRLLAPSGLLMLGHAESSSLLGERFRPAGPRGSFAFVRGGDPAPPVSASASGATGTLPPAPPVLPPPSSGPPIARLPAPAPGARPGASQTPRQATPPKVEPPAEGAGIEARPPRRLDEAAQFADLGRHDEAARLCEQDIHARGPNAPAYFLLGMVRQAAGDRAGAQACFEKAVYLDGRHEEALLALALLAQRRGDLTAAAHYRRRAGRAFQENQGP